MFDFVLRSFKQKQITNCSQKYYEYQEQKTLKLHQIEKTKNILNHNNYNQFNEIPMKILPQKQ
jgi:hypothetical protein